MWLKGSKRAEVSASEDEVDSEFEDDVDDAEGPTLVTVDDGKGGVKHVKVAHHHHHQHQHPHHHHHHHQHHNLCHNKIMILVSFSFCQRGQNQHIIINFVLYLQMQSHH